MHKAKSTDRRSRGFSDLGSNETWSLFALNLSAWRLFAGSLGAWNMTVRVALPWLAVSLGMTAGACGAASPGPETAEATDDAATRVDVLLAQATELANGGRRREAHDVLRQAAQEAESANLVERRVRALRRLGGMLLVAEELESSLQVLSRAADLERHRSPQGSALLALVLSAQGEVVQARGRYPEARALYQEALSLALREDLRTDRAEAEARFAFGTFLARMRELDEALVHLRRSVELRSSLFGASSPTHLDAMEALGAALDYGGQYEEAEALFREILAKREVAPQPTVDDVPRALTNLAVNLDMQGRSAEALAPLERAQTLATADPPASRELRSQIALALGNAYRAGGRVDEAKQQYAACLALRETLYGQSHPVLGVPLFNLAMVAMDQSEPEVAVEHLERAIAVRSSVLPDDHPWMIETRERHAQAQALIADSESSEEPGPSEQEDASQDGGAAESTGDG